jgi:Flp pilus assembly protein TadG
MTMKIQVHSATTEKQRGQSLVEMAILTPVILLILLGAIDFGRVFYSYITITNAARVGAQFGMDPRRAPAEIRDIIKDEASPRVTLSDADITFTTASWSAGNTLTVLVRTNFTALTPLISNFWGGGPLAISNSVSTRFSAN